MKAASLFLGLMTVFVGVNGQAFTSPYGLTNANKTLHLCKSDDTRDDRLAMSQPRNRIAMRVRRARGTD